MQPAENGQTCSMNKRGPEAGWPGKLGVPPRLPSRSQSCGTCRFFFSSAFPTVFIATELEVANMFSWFKLNRNLGPAKTAKISGFGATAHISRSVIHSSPPLSLVLATENPSRVL